MFLCCALIILPDFPYFPSFLFHPTFKIDCLRESLIRSLLSQETLYHFTLCIGYYDLVRYKFELGGRVVVVVFKFYRLKSFKAIVRLRFMKLKLRILSTFIVHILFCLNTL